MLPWSVSPYRGKIIRTNIITSYINAKLCPKIRGSDLATFPSGATRPATPAEAIFSPVSPVVWSGDFFLGTIDRLLDALRQIGASDHYISPNGCGFAVLRGFRVRDGGFRGGVRILEQPSVKGELFFHIRHREDHRAFNGSHRPARGAPAHVFFDDRPEHEHSGKHLDGTQRFAVGSEHGVIEDQVRVVPGAFTGKAIAVVDGGGFLPWAAEGRTKKDQKR